MTSLALISKRKGGAPRKVPGGLDRVLFVRTNEELLAKLEQIQAERSQASGVALSKADIVRALLWEAIGREEKAQ